MRKTAIMQLLEYKDELIKNGELTTLGIFQEVISKANELLETEKQQIVEAYDSGFGNGICVCPSLDEGKDYFNATFQK